MSNSAVFLDACILLGSPVVSILLAVFTEEKHKEELVQAIASPRQECTICLKTYLCHQRVEIEIFLLLAPLQCKDLFFFKRTISMWIHSFCERNTIASNTRDLPEFIPTRMDKSAVPGPSVSSSSLERPLILSIHSEVKRAWMLHWLDNNNLGCGLELYRRCYVDLPWQWRDLLLE